MNKKKYIKPFMYLIILWGLAWLSYAMISNINTDLQKSSNITFQNEPKEKPFLHQISPKKPSPDRVPLNDNTENIKPEKSKNGNDHHDAFAEAKEEEQELLRMQQMLPGNSWLPVQSESNKQSLVDIIALENKIYKKTATVDEKKKYFAAKIEKIQQKIDLIRYYQERTQYLKQTTGKEYLSTSDIEEGNKAVETLAQEKESYEKQLAQLKPEQTNDSSNAEHDNNQSSSDVAEFNIDNVSF
jgi:hypothetical protein